MTAPDPLTELLGRYAAVDFDRLRDHEEQAIADSLTAAGFHVVRTSPADVVAVNTATYGRLHRYLDETTTEPWTPRPVADLSGWPVVLDESLPDSDIHFRPTAASPERNTP